MVFKMQSNINMTTSCLCVIWESNRGVWYLIPVIHVSMISDFFLYKMFTKSNIFIYLDLTSQNSLYSPKYNIPQNHMKQNMDKFSYIVQTIKCNHSQFILVFIFRSEATDFLIFFPQVIEDIPISSTCHLNTKFKLFSHFYN